MNIVNRNLPKLKHISRPASWNTLTFGVFNLLLGVALFSTSAYTLDEFFIVQSFFSEQFWGSAFFSVGVIMMLGYYLNRWVLMRQITVLALFLKFFWLTALITRQIQDPQSSTFLILMFGTLAVLQIGHYLYFPSVKEAKGGKPVGNLNIPKEMLK